MPTRLIVLILPLLWACHAPVETRQNHVVHRGEQAVLTAANGNAFLALEREDCYHVQQAVSSRDKAWLETMEMQDKVLRVAAGTPVKVLQDSYNERKVEILEGPLAGKTGWVAWEFLSPPPPAGR
ncbi:MAG: hypothetical protein HY858_07395 [Candidatus Solibacter usitatus]|nr:hypothetical protein [Candidatus Solibacter usitatus]